MVFGDIVVGAPNLWHHHSTRHVGVEKFGRYGGYTAAWSLSGLYFKSDSEIAFQRTLNVDWLTAVTAYNTCSILLFANVANLRATALESGGSWR